MAGVSEETKVSSIAVADEEDYDTLYPDKLRMGIPPEKKDVISREKRFVQVCANLFLSSADAAEDERNITREKITHVVHLAGRIINYSASLRETGIKQEAFVIHDDDIDCTPTLIRISLWIQSALKEEKSRVLVHCVMGSSRSPTVVAAYLVHSGVIPSGDDAFKCVMKAAPWIIPSGYFQTLVRRLEKQV